MHWLLHWLGLDSPSGWTYLAWSGVVGSGLLGFLGAHFHRKLSRHHAAITAQAERHHTEAMAQRQAHHSERLHQAERHHQQLFRHTPGRYPEVTGETGETCDD